MLRPSIWRRRTSYCCGHVCDSYHQMKQPAVISETRYGHNGCIQVKAPLSNQSLQLIEPIIYIQIPELAGQRKKYLSLTAIAAAHLGSPAEILSILPSFRLTKLSASGTWQTPLGGYSADDERLERSKHMFFVGRWLVFEKSGWKSEPRITRLIIIE